MEGLCLRWATVLLLSAVGACEVLSRSARSFWNLKGLGGDQGFIFPPVATTILGVFFWLLQFPHSVILVVQS